MALHLFQRRINLLDGSFWHLAHHRLRAGDYRENAFFPSKSVMNSAGLMRLDPRRFQ